MSDTNWQVIEGDCLLEMPKMQENSADSIVCDPPYGMSFGGKDWDHGVPGKPFWQEAMRVAKPGAYLLAFGGTRTFHRLASAIEDAGWEIRDCIIWAYFTGFPKSLDISKQLDKSAGAKREVIRTEKQRDMFGDGSQSPTKDGRNMVCSGAKRADGLFEITAPTTDAAKKWEGWGTALKPSYEPIVVARKPMNATIIKNITKWGCGGINVDKCRVVDNVENTGRWPSNVILDGSNEVLNEFPDSVGDKVRQMFKCFPTDDTEDEETHRLVYCAKASQKDRNEGLASKSNHPTVKPTKLMRYLCKLVTQPNGLVLDPFAGSGSTGKAALLEGFNFVGIEKEHEYVEIAKTRCQHVSMRIK